MSGMRVGRGFAMAWASSWLVLAAIGFGSAPAPARSETVSDVTEARTLFLRNLDAIQRRDRAGYLNCYLASPLLAVTGAQGFVLGYDAFARNAGDAWPDQFEARDLWLTPIKAGIVYGTYRYRVRYGDVEQSGLSERLFLDTPGGWRIAMTSAFQALAGVPAPPCAVVGGTLLDGTGRAAIENAVVLVRDGRIEAAGALEKLGIPAGYDTVSARGRFVIPGLIDTHVHYSQTGWVDGRPDALDLRARYPYDGTMRRLSEHPEVFHRAWLACGVTSVFDVGGYPWTVAMSKRTDRDSEAPHVTAAGPLLTTYDFWLNLPGEKQFMFLKDSTAAVEGVRYLKSIGADAVKVWFIVRPGSDFDAMARNVMVAGAEAAKQRLPLIVHATGLREAKAALRAGATLLVHSVDDKALDVEFLSLAKATRVFYCPTLSVLDGYAKLPMAARTGTAPTLDDPLGAVDSLTRARVALTGDEARRVMGANAPLRDSLFDARRKRMVDNLVIARRSGITVVTGTDAGNPLTLHGPAIFAEMEAMQRAGMKPGEVLLATTRDAARAIGRLAEAGTIEKGKSADLVILSADPRTDIANMRRIEYVMRAGVGRSSAEMKAAIAKTKW